MLHLLCEITKKLNHGNVRWALGGSLMLYLKNLAQHSNDIDIFVHEEDIEIADNILSEMGTKSAKRADIESIYLTKHFFEYKIDGSDIDLMSGLKIKHQSGVYSYTFDSLSITDTATLKNTSIPLTALEDWYVLYQIMDHGAEKAYLIQNHLTYHGIKHPLLLKRALREDLPEEARERIEDFLYSQYPEYIDNQKK